MSIKLILVFIISLITKKAQGQDFFLLQNDSNSIKNLCYLMVCSDQLNTGAVKMSDFNFDSASVSMTKIIPLKSQGLSGDLLFFMFTVNTGKDTKSYNFCYNQQYRVFYRIAGFLNNDFYAFFEYLKELKMKLNKNYFSKKKVTVESIDIFCLLEFYNTKSKSKNKLVIAEGDRQTFSCLSYNYQPVVVN